MSSRRVVFLLLDGVEILDLAGPLQTLHEANRLGAEYEILISAPGRSVVSDQRVLLAGLEPLVEAREQDLIFIPGIPVDSLPTVAPEVFKWLGAANRNGASFYSICTGAFVLGEAGLLDGKQCTTHWTRVSDLQERFPRSKVVENRLFVRDGSVTTSAGIAAGIDLTLSVVEEHYSPRLAAAVAREMVVYMRRDASHQQESVYTSYRSHVHDGIHRVQDNIVRCPEKRQTLAQLADIANMSERNLTRAFRQTTGISVGAFTNLLRLEMARHLITDSLLNIETIALRCGFESSRQLRRTARRHLGSSLSDLRQK